MDPGKKKRLLACKHLVEVDSANYQKLVPSQIDGFAVSELPEDVSSDELKKVYDEKFARADTVGRTYYDSIMVMYAMSCPPHQ